MNKNNNKLKTSGNSNGFVEGEAFAAEAGNMLSGMASGMAKSMFRTKLFWGALSAFLVAGAGSIYFLVWAVQTIAGG